MVQMANDVALARINLHAEMTRECEAAGIDENAARLSWSKKSITNRLSYAKMSLIPPLTESGELPEQLKTTNTGQQFLRFEVPDGSKLFVDDVGLDFLRRSNCWKGDGTFKSAPNGFTQVYSLHARHLRGESIPVMHMLLKGKDFYDYYAMFKFLNDLLEEQGNNRSIGALSMVLFDYEGAARKAFVAAFKAEQRRIKVRGCRFHFGQAIIRNIDAKGLKTIKNQPEVAKWIKQILGLPLLPPQYVRQIWFSHLRHPPTVSGFEAAFLRFVKYSETEWLRMPKKAGRRLTGKSLEKSDEYTRLWNHFDNTMCRTTNSAEGWHSGLKSTWRGVNPKENNYVDWLIKAHDEHVTRMVQLDAGLPLKRRDPRYIRLDENIARAKMRFQTREAIEMMDEAPDMSDIILRHLRYVACLFGYAKWNDANSVDANLNEPVSNAASINADLEVESVAEEDTVLNPAQISIFDSAPSLQTGQQQHKCPAFVHTFLPPCTHRRLVLPVVQLPVAQLPVTPSSITPSSIAPSFLPTHTFLPPLYDAHAMAVLDAPLEEMQDSPVDETETAAAAISMATTSAINAVYSMCMRCSEFTLDVCARCSQPLHATCAPITGDSIFFCEQCCTTIVQRGIANAELRRQGEYDAIKVELSQYFH